MKITSEFEKWIGYCEKDNVNSLGIDLDRVESYDKGAGFANNTIFAKVYEKLTGISVQGQPWCDTFVDTIFIHVYGVDRAKKLLGGFSAYTPTSANYFRAMRRWVTSNPQEGDVIFFKNSQRIYHTGYVVSYNNGTLVTIEGNTSTGSTIIENGGLVAKKSYDYNRTKDRIAGFGRPDYYNEGSIGNDGSGSSGGNHGGSSGGNHTEDNGPAGWRVSADGKRWWWMRADGTYPTDCWLETDGLRYRIDEKGYVRVGSWAIGGVRHYFSEKGIVGAEMYVNDVPKGVGKESK